ncbi:MAG: YqaA family protein [Mariprofundaceae bacterium]|nr:YqaA family protein [Mariprofundaceae bacterium]
MLSFSDLDWTLFSLAFISSTLVPGGSEAYLLYQLQAEGSHVYALLMMATLGNVLGSIVTYSMGRMTQYWGDSWIQRRFRINPTHIIKAEAHFQRYGRFALLFAWLPIIGDPLCFVAGVLRYSWFWFVVLVTLGKLARYSLLAWVFF